MRYIENGWWYVPMHSTSMSTIHDSFHRMYRIERSSEQIWVELDETKITLGVLECEGTPSRALDYSKNDTFSAEIVWKPQVSTPEVKMPENLSREARSPIRNTRYMIVRRLFI